MACMHTAPVKCKEHHAQTQALLDAVVERNAALFDPSEALEAERELSHCADVARTQLADLGPAEAAQLAAQVHEYKEAIWDLNRSRPVFRPCKASAKVPLVRIRLIMLVALKPLQSRNGEGCTLLGVSCCHSCTSMRYSRSETSRCRSRPL